MEAPGPNKYTAICLGFAFVLFFSIAGLASSMGYRAEDQKDESLEISRNIFICISAFCVTSLLIVIVKNWNCCYKSYKVDQKEKFPQSSGLKPTVKNNFKQFKPFDLEKIKVEDFKPAVSVDATDCQPADVAGLTVPEERWRQCYVSFEN